MINEKIERINQLAKKSRQCELTEEEKQEQKTLRQEYIDAMKSSMRATLNNVVVVDKDGKKTNLSSKNNK